jgi:putative transposase
VEIRRADRDGQGRWSFTSQQQTLRRLDRAFQGFFQRVRAGRRAGYPRFETVARWDSVDFVDRDGARWHAVEGKWAAAYFQGVGQVKVRPRWTPGTPASCATCAVLAALVPSRTS